MKIEKKKVIPIALAEIKVAWEDLAPPPQKKKSLFNLVIKILIPQIYDYTRLVVQDNISGNAQNKIWITVLWHFVPLEVLTVIIIMYVYCINI